MKKKSVTFTIMGSIIFILFSCENDMDYKNKNTTPKLTMNGFIYTDSLENIIYLNYTGKFEPGHVDDATVEIYINGEKNETATVIQPVDWNNPQKSFSIKSKFKPGDVVRIEAKTGDGKHHAWIEESVPYPIDILQLDTVNIPVGINDYTYLMKKLRIKIRFKDRENEKNYYRISIEQNRKKTYYSYITMENFYEYHTGYFMWPWEDIVLTDGRPATSEELENDLFERVKNVYGVFDDSRFKDTEYTMTVQTWIESIGNFWDDYVVLKNTKIDIIVKLLSITQNEYEYLKVMNYIESDIFDEYLNDPVKIPSNVHGGTGFVGISSGTSLSMESVINQDFDENLYINR